MGKVEGACLLKVQGVLATLPPSEQRVALRVLEHPRKVVQSTITELARECDVSESTVVRFCKNLGLDGYKEFRIAIAQELGALIPELVVGELDTAREMGTLAESVFSNNIRALQATLNSLDYEAVNRAIDALASARRVDFYGAGPSSVVAMDAYIKFMRIGLSTGYNSNAHLQAVSAAVLTPLDVAVGISYSGSTRDTIDALTIARNTGATTVAVTNFHDMPICDAADIVICTSADESLFQGGAMASRTAQLAVIDLIFVGTVSRRPDVFSGQFAKTRAALLAKLRGCSNASPQSNRSDRALPRKENERQEQGSGR
ncbi:MAG: MurR/RpiR family transcriptional regulator [Clostridia bacterium]|nr:MurR/RpiR family transcriptional regulator [Clostridia bacterium]